MTQHDQSPLPPEPPADPSGALAAAPSAGDGKPQPASQPASRSRTRPRQWHALSPRQQRFITHYLVLGNATRAAIAAGYSPSHAKDHAYLLLRRPDVAAAIAAEQGKARAQAEVTVERIVAELAKLAFADPRDLFTAEGRLKPIHELDEANAASIAAMEVLVMAGTRGTRRPAAGGSAGARSTGARSTGARSAGARRASAGSGAAADARTEGEGMDGDGMDDEGMDGGGIAGDGMESTAAETPVLELRKIKRWDKTKALELLGRYLGLFKDRVELGVSSDLATAIEAARKRVRDGQVGDRQLGEGATVIEGKAVATDADEAITARSRGAG